MPSTVSSVRGAGYPQAAFAMERLLDRAARDDAPAVRPVDDARLEGRRLPQLERLRRLDVVMSIDNEVRAAGSL